MKRMMPARPSASLGARERDRRLALIAAVIERDEPQEALSLLHEFFAVYPDDMMGHLLKAAVHEDMEDYEQCEQEASWLVKHYPDSQECHELWVSSAATCDMFAVFIQRANQCLKRWPGMPYLVKLGDTLRETEEGLRLDVEDFCTAPANWLELAAADEEALFLMRYDRFDEAIELCINALKTAPEFIPISNTLAICRLEIGQIDEARSEFEGLLVASRSPAIALGCLVKIGLLQGRYSEAKELARRMRAECGPDWSTAVANTLTLAGEFEYMREYYEELVATSEVLEPAFKHYAAVAYARLGNTAKAKELWKDALKEAPGFKQAKINLSGMEAPAGTRSGPWSHVVDEYLPLAAWHDIFQVMTGDSDLATESWQTLLTEWPELLNVAPIVLERADDFSRKIALSLLLNDEIENHKDVLLDFASGRNGSDELRAGVYFYLAEAGLLAPGNYTFWHIGARREIPTYEIPLLSSVAKMNPADSDVLAAEAYAALNQDRFAEALDGFMIALAKHPDSPMLRNNIAAAYKGLGDEQKYIEITSDLFDDHPEYTFARTNMALIQMDAGNLGAARGLLKPLSERSALRPSEYEAVYTSLMRLATLEGDTDAARKWLEALEQAAPASELVTNWKQSLLDMQNYRAPRLRGKKKNRTTHAQKTLF